MSKAQGGQVHGVLGQVPGHRERVDVLETGEPQLHAHKLEHGVAFAPKYLNQQELSLLVGHHPCSRWMATEHQGGGRDGRDGRQRPVKEPGTKRKLWQGPDGKSKKQGK